MDNQKGTLTNRQLKEGNLCRTIVIDDCPLYTYLHINNFFKENGKSIVSGFCIDIMTLFIGWVAKIAENKQAREGI